MACKCNDRSVFVLKSLPIGAYADKYNRNALNNSSLNAFQQALVNRPILRLQGKHLEELQHSLSDAFVFFLFSVFQAIFFSY